MCTLQDREMYTVRPWDYTLGLWPLWAINGSLQQEGLIWIPLSTSSILWVASKQFSQDCHGTPQPTSARSFKHVTNAIRTAV